MSEKKKDNELMKSGAALPSIGKNETVVGQENIDSQDIIFPRIRLLQPISDDVVEKGLKAGAFMNSMTGEVVDHLEMLMFFYFKSRTLFNRSMGAGEGVSCMSANGKNSLDGKKCSECALGMWETLSPEQRTSGTKPSGPKCDVGHNFPCLVLNSNTPEIPVAMTLKRTSSGQAKQLLSLIKLARMQWWSMVFKVVSKLTKNDKGNFYVFEIKPLRPATDDEQKKGLMFYQGLVGKNISVDENDKDDFRGRDNHSTNDGHDDPDFQ